MALINYYRKVLYLSHVVSEQVPGKDNCPLSYCIHAEKVLTDILSTRVVFFSFKSKKAKESSAYLLDLFSMCHYPAPFPPSSSAFLYPFIPSQAESCDPSSAPMMAASCVLPAAGRKI